MYATTILGVKRDGEVAIGGDGQVTLGDNIIIKQHARKLRRLYNGKVLAGFAGSVADSFTLFEKFEEKLNQYSGNLLRAAVELTKEWRVDKFLRRLEALLIIADKDYLLVVSGNGEVVEPDDGVAAIGSGGGYALAAARALLNFSNLSAYDIVKESLQITANICVYTNKEIIIEKL